MDHQEKLIRMITNSFVNFKKLGKDMMTAGACISRLEQLKKRWQEFEQNHAKLLEDEAVSPEHEYLKKGQYDIVYETFLTNMGLFQDQLLQVKREISQLSAQPGADGLIAEMDINRAKLPRIVISDFSGDIQDWVRFRDTFKEMVIDRPNLPNIFKMNYLRTYVKGEAAELLQEVPSGEEHFPTAWRVLLSHYDNRRLLVNKLMTKLMALPPMANESAAELMRVLNGVRNLLQALKALGSPVDHWDHFTIFLTRSKITQKCQSKWEDNVKQAGGPTVPDTFENLSLRTLSRKLLKTRASLNRLRRVGVISRVTSCKRNRISRFVRYALRRILSSNAPSSGGRASVRGKRLSEESGYVTTVSAHI
ncbi:unnamed protein product [Trichogramma brassicae]|uniref:Uncharacterized protein n=1 Tax=Trichogramma brassicae TaxID=86971 RepID=A0A6H5I2C2_9HYME|nr:unnamed protein product [Trichogramma brassicae]